MSIQVDKREREEERVHSRREWRERERSWLPASLRHPVISRYAFENDQTPLLKGEEACLHDPARKKFILFLKQVCGIPEVNFERNIYWIYFDFVSTTANI